MGAVNLRCCGYQLRNFTHLKRLAFWLIKRLAPTEWQDEYVRQRWVRPADFTDLSLAFVDHLNRKWYEYPAGMALPLCRMDASVQSASFLSAMISDELIEETRADVNKALAHGDMVSAGAILSRLFDTRKEIIPMDVVINCVALTLVREDERPDQFDRVIHQDKIDYLKGCIERGDRFFFQLTEVKRLSRTFKISEDHWAMLLERFEEVKHLRKKERDHILSKLSSAT